MSKVSFVVFLFLVIINSVAEAGDYYKDDDKCVIEGMPGAFEIGDKIAYGEPIANKYEHILIGDEFNKNDDIIEPLHVAYAFYIIAERIGDPRGVVRQRWAEPYMDVETKDKIISAVYRKYSATYLQKCLSVNNNVVEKNKKDIDKDTNYYLYMHGGG